MKASEVFAENVASGPKPVNNCANCVSDGIRLNLRMMVRAKRSSKNPDAMMAAERSSLSTNSAWTNSEFAFNTF
jgi:hypothetical protein